MLQDERLVTYIRSLDLPLSPFLEELRESAMEEGVPIIRPEMQSFLQIFLTLKKPERIRICSGSSAWSWGDLPRQWSPVCC